MKFLSRLFSKKIPEQAPKPFETLNESLDFVTDTASLALFDPEVLQHRLYDESDWWCNDFNSYEEVIKGFISLVSLAADGQYRLRLTSADTLTNIEKQSIKKVINPLGLKIISGNLFIGGGEYLPGENYSPRQNSIEEYQGAFIQLPPNDYDITLYAMEYDKPRFDLVDIVVQIRPRKSPFPGLSEEPKI